MNAVVLEPVANSVIKQITIPCFVYNEAFVPQASVELLLTTRHLGQNMNKA